MEREAGGIIKKIQWGIIPGEKYLVVQVGSVAIRGRDATIDTKEVFDAVISDIVEDKNVSLEIQTFEYNVFAKRDGEEPFFWKRFTKKPDLIEYFAPKEIEERVV